MIIDIVASRGITITVVETGLSTSFPVLRIDYSPEASVTEHPVELGAEVTDHVQVRPLRFTVECKVTASPLGIPDPFAIEHARTFLEGALGKLLTVNIPGEGIYPNCVLEAFPFARTNEEARTFSLRFRQVRIAAAVSVPIPARLPAPVAAAGAPSETPLGQQATAPVAADTSTLFDLFSFVGIF